MARGHLLDRLTIRPVVAGDAMALAAAFDRLSPETRYQRFLGHKKQLSPAELERFANVNHVDHEAIAALDGAELVGVARFIRDRGDPRVGELAVTVGDRYQGRGVGTILLQRLIERAVEEGLTQLRAEMLVENRRALAFLRRTCCIRHARYAGMGVIEAWIDLPARSAPTQHCEEAA